MTDGSVSVWICGSCKRRVPVRVGECRCGATRLDVPLPDVEESIEEAPSPLRGLLKGAAFLLLVGVSVAWYRSFDGAPTKPRTLRPLPPGAAAVAPVAAIAQQAAPAPKADPPLGAPGVSMNPIVERPASDPWSGVQLRVPRPATRTPPQVREQSAEPLTEADSRRVEGLVKLQGVYSGIAAQAGRLVEMAETYERNCGASQVDSRCTQLFEQIGRSAVFVGAALDDAEEICRTHWLEPGVTREAREAFGLDDRVWDDLARVVRQHNR